MKWDFTYEDVRIIRLITPLPKLRKTYSNEKEENIAFLG